MKHERAKVNGVELHYLVEGRGDPVVLLHGWPQTSYEWRKIMARLAEKYTVVAPDLRGLGDSSRPDGGYDKRTLAADVHALAAHLRLGPVRLAGHDWGGVVAYTYAADHRADVKRLAVFDVVLPEPSLERMPLLARSGFNPAWHFAFHNVHGLAETLLEGREEAYLRWWFTTGSARPGAFAEEDIREYVRAYSQPGAMRAGFEYYRAVFKDIDDHLELGKEKLTIPVLAVGGERTFGAMVEQSLRAVAENVRGAVLPDCGHWVTEEKPDEVAAMLLAFFGDEERP